MYTEAQINFGDLIPYLTYGSDEVDIPSGRNKMFPSKFPFFNASDHVLGHKVHVSIIAIARA
jgi:hypothetical protein